MDLAEQDGVSIAAQIRSVGRFPSWPSRAVRNNVGLVADDRVAVSDSRVHNQFPVAMGAPVGGASPQKSPIAIR